MGEKKWRREGEEGEKRQDEKGNEKNNGHVLKVIDVMRMTANSNNKEERGEEIDGGQGALSGVSRDASGPSKEREEIITGRQTKGRKGNGEDK